MFNFFLFFVLDLILCLFDEEYRMNLFVFFVVREVWVR